MATTYLTRTLGTPTSTQKCTISFWVKLSNLSAEKSIFEQRFNDGTNKQISLYFGSNDDLQLQLVTGGSYDGRIYTSQLFRDVSAWYHVLIAIDTTLATSGDRLRMYINGNEVTSFSTELQPTQNYNLHFTSGQLLYIGRNSSGSAYLDGSMAHFHFIDGTAYDADTFGETDATTGIWKPKTAPSVTYGTNGFFLKFENSGAFGTDSSGNANTFTVNGTMTQNIDTPSNVFATMNALQYSPNTTFSNGNNVVTQSVGGNGARRFTSSLGASSGKYYWETKITGTVNGMTFGIVDGVEGDYNNYVGYKSKEVGYEKDGVIYKNAVITDTGFAVLVLNDIVNHALDLDNGYIYFGVNGTWQNSGVPTSGATGTGGFSITADTLYHPAVSAFANTGQISFNFGNGYFGTTAVSSAQNPDDGIGIFEYDVPAGYYALNTKAINAQEYD